MTGKYTEVIYVLVQILNDSDKPDYNINLLGINPS